VTEAWIGFAGGILGAVIAAVVAVRQSRMDKHLALLTRELDREERAEEVLTRYREPLAAAAFDLQSRLFNILQLDFLGKFGDGDRSRSAFTTTLFRLAQYFGWTEILRRDIQFLSFPADADTRKVADLQARIARCFLTDEYGPELMVWSDEQRAVGERMIVEEHGKVICMGYARFRDECEKTFAPWLERLQAELPAAAADGQRLRAAQHLLCELVEALGAVGVRYTPEQLTRAEARDGGR